MVAYFTALKEVIASFSRLIANISISEKSYSDTKGFISGEIDFIDNSRLDFAEVKDTEKAGKLKYRYHYMDEQGLLIFRYDNAKHYPDLENFPHHKHTPNGVFLAGEPELQEVMHKIAPKVLENSK